MSIESKEARDRRRCLKTPSITASISLEALKENEARCQARQRRQSTVESIHGRQCPPGNAGGFQACYARTALPSRETRKVDNLDFLRYTRRCPALDRPTRADAKRRSRKCHAGPPQRSAHAPEEIFWEGSDLSSALLLCAPYFQAPRAPLWGPWTAPKCPPT